MDALLCLLGMICGRPGCCSASCPLCLVLRDGAAPFTGFNVNLQNRSLDTPPHLSPPLPFSPPQPPLARRVKRAKAKRAAEKAGGGAQTEQERSSQIKKEAAFDAAAARRRDAKLQQAKALLEPGGGGRGVGLDPGFTKIATCARHSQAAEEALMMRKTLSPGQPPTCGTRHATGDKAGKFETCQISKGEYRERCGIVERSQTMRLWISKNADVQHFNSAAPSPAVATAAEYGQRCSTVLDALQALLAFYVTARRVRRKRFGAYIKRQKALEAMCAKVCGTKDPEQQQRTVVAFGDASLGRNMRGVEPVISKAFKNFLSARCCVVDTTEFRSSQCCCCCYERMKGKKWKDASGKTHESYTVRTCNNRFCLRTSWHRDVNAAINILFFLLRELRGEPLPKNFRRDNNGRPEVEAPLEAAGGSHGG